MKRILLLGASLLSFGSLIANTINPNTPARRNASELKNFLAFAKEGERAIVAAGQVAGSSPLNFLSAGRGLASGSGTTVNPNTGVVIIDARTTNFFGAPNSPARSAGSNTTDSATGAISPSAGATSLSQSGGISEGAGAGPSGGIANTAGTAAAAVNQVTGQSAAPQSFSVFDPGPFFSGSDYSSFKAADFLPPPQASISAATIKAVGSGINAVINEVFAQNPNGAASASPTPPAKNVARAAAPQPTDTPTQPVANVFPLSPVNATAASSSSSAATVVAKNETATEKKSENETPKTEPETPKKKQVDDSDEPSSWKRKQDKISAPSSGECTAAKIYDTVKDYLKSNSDLLWAVPLGNTCKIIMNRNLGDIAKKAIKGCEKYSSQVSGNTLLITSSDDDVTNIKKVCGIAKAALAGGDPIKDNNTPSNKVHEAVLVGPPLPEGYEAPAPQKLEEAQ